MKVVLIHGRNVEQETDTIFINNKQIELKGCKYTACAFCGGLRTVTDTTKRTTKHFTGHINRLRCKRCSYVTGETTCTEHNTHFYHLVCEHGRTEKHDY